MSILLSIIIILIVIVIIRYHWQRRNIYTLAYKLDGPPALPIIGNGLLFLGKQEDILKKITTVGQSYAKPVRFWFGPHLVLYFSHPDHIEKILSSSKMSHKHDLYDVVKIYLGDGLVSNSGEKYKKHRRLIQPLFSIKFVSNNIETFQKHINIYLKKLEQHVGQKTFDIHDLIHDCFVDIIAEIVLGTQLDAQFGRNADYVKATTDMYTVGYDRLMKPWLHPEIIYSFTKGKKAQDQIIDITTKFIRKVLEQSRLRTKSNIKMGITDDPSVPIIDQIAEIIEKNPTAVNDIDFLYHMFTLYAASEDTMTVISAVLCVCMGMYPEYQKLAAEEICMIIGKEPRNISYDELANLRYLDMCVRDVLRLIPIAPLIVRKTIEDFTLNEFTIPKGCGTVISIFEVHRDPQHWENPDHFHPDHFLPENVRNRHPFAYVPFSAGPRSCIGKIFGFAGVKLMMANILQRFEIEADGKFPDIVLRADITIRSVSGYNVRLKERKW